MCSELSSEWIMQTIFICVYSSVTLGKLFQLSVPWFFHPRKQQWLHCIYTQVDVRIKWDNPSKGLSMWQLANEFELLEANLLLFLLVSLLLLPFLLRKLSLTGLSLGFSWKWKLESCLLPQGRKGLRRQPKNKSYFYSIQKLFPPHVSSL